MLLEHPAVVGEQLLEAHAHGEDEQEPQHGAEEQCRHQRLALVTHGLAANTQRDKRRTVNTNRDNEISDNDNH